MGIICQTEESGFVGAIVYEYYLIISIIFLNIFKKIIMIIFITITNIF